MLAGATPILTLAISESPYPELLSALIFTL